MMDGMDDESEILNCESQRDLRSETVDLTDNALIVDISDALSEKDKVKFTVHTKTTLPEFLKTDFTVVRQHEEFVWLYDRFEENPEYSVYIIPPAPPRPDFDASREKLQKLGEGEGTITKEEYAKMKQELEAEYLATFKKTVAMHEMFLCRLADHPVFRLDSNFRVFLEYDQDLAVKNKNKIELIEGFMKSLTKSTDDFLLSATVKDVNEFFEQQKNFLIGYHNNLKDATVKADRMTAKHKDVADIFIKISMSLMQIATTEHSDLETFLTKVAATFEKLRKSEARVASDEDLKLSDTLRYYMRDTFAAKRLLYKRLRCLSDYETANRNLEKARAKNKDLSGAENAQQRACELFEQMSDKGKEELDDFKMRRVQAFKKNLVELAELEIKHAKAQVQILKTCIASLKADE